ncbi:MAG TPA: triose-phosphate isomerase [Candidatus Paceibacterota bacterium]|jgi:triosephosphate isomerase|nr:triose-phosphate isomerase [Candidatus Paceibacterota bacterium]
MKYRANKRKIIVGNWKMNPLRAKDAEKLFKNVATLVSQVKKTDIVVAVPFIYLDRLGKIRTSKIKLGAQDSFGVDTGPFTGEISPEMLYDIGARYVILGHSERRELGEGNELINKKIKGALASGLVPILCVGEKSRDENHEYFEIVKTQVEECLNGISKNSLSKIIIAYEPVWALSSTANRRDATPTDSEEMVIFIKKTLADKFGAKAELPRIIYGGSANEKDALDFLMKGGVDGLLPGKASLSAKKFSKIIEICEASNN